MFHLLGSSRWLLGDHSLCRVLSSAAQVSPSSAQGHREPSHALRPSVSIHPEGGLREILSFLTHWYEDKNMITRPLLLFSDLAVHEMLVQPRA